MSMTSNLCVVKNYHTFIKLNAGYANFVCVGILLLLLVSFLDFERKLKTGCEKAFIIAFSNRQVVDLPFLQWRAYKRSEYVSHSIYWGFVQGGYPALCLLAPLEKRIKIIKL